MNDHTRLRNGHAPGEASAGLAAAPVETGVYAALGWRLFPAIDRVYVNAAARAALGWRPAHDFGRALADLAGGRDFRSALAREVGAKGYHAAGVDPGPYAAT